MLLVMPITLKRELFDTLNEYTDTISMSALYEYTDTHHQVALIHVPKDQVDSIAFEVTD